MLWGGRMKKIGVLTSGGDCSGLNAAIRAVALRARQLNIETVGVINSTVGLLERPVTHINFNNDNFSLHPLLSQSGTILGTVNKGNPFDYPLPDGTFKDVSDDMVEGYRQLGLDAIIIIGGDGSMEIIGKLAKKGNIPFIGIPKTIDNDVPGTDFPIGFHTAVATNTSIINELHYTAKSHNRVIIVEVMGRDAGHLALHSGLASGAHAILLPELPYNLNNTIQAVRDIHKKNGYGIIVCSEAMIEQNKESSFIKNIDNKKIFTGAAQKLADSISKVDKSIDIRVNTLSHIQRSNPTVAFDKLIATNLGVEAVNAIVAGKSNELLGWKDNKVISTALDVVLSSEYQNVKSDNQNLITARNLGIYLGE